MPTEVRRLTWSGEVGGSTPIPYFNSGKSVRRDVAAVRLVATIAPPLSRREGDNGLALGTVTVVQPERREGGQGRRSYFAEYMRRATGVGYCSQGGMTTLDGWSGHSY